MVQITSRERSSPSLPPSRVYTSLVEDFSHVVEDQPKMPPCNQGRKHNHASSDKRRKDRPKRHGRLHTPITAIGIMNLVQIVSHKGRPDCSKVRPVPFIKQPVKGSQIDQEHGHNGQSTDHCPHSATLVDPLPKLSKTHLTHSRSVSASQHFHLPMHKAVFFTLSMHTRKAEG